MQGRTRHIQSCLGTRREIVAEAAQPPLKVGGDELVPRRLVQLPLDAVLRLTIRSLLARLLRVGHILLDDRSSWCPGGQSAGARAVPMSQTLAFQ